MTLLDGKAVAEKIKKELKEKIDNIQIGMVEESLKNERNSYNRCKWSCKSGC